MKRKAFWTAIFSRIEIVKEKILNNFKKFWSFWNISKAYIVVFSLCHVTGLGLVQLCKLSSHLILFPKYPCQTVEFKSRPVYKTFKMNLSNLKKIPNTAFNHNFHSTNASMISNNKPNSLMQLMHDEQSYLRQVRIKVY